MIETETIETIGTVGATWQQNWGRELAPATIAIALALEPRKGHFWTLWHVIFQLIEGVDESRRFIRLFVCVCLPAYLSMYRLSVCLSNFNAMPPASAWRRPAL